VKPHLLCQQALKVAEAAVGVDSLAMNKVGDLLLGVK
jgi:hypothetical protein